MSLDIDLKKHVVSLNDKDFAKLDKIVHAEKIKRGKLQERDESMFVYLTIFNIVCIVFAFIMKHFVSGALIILVTGLSLYAIFYMNKNYKFKKFKDYTMSVMMIMIFALMINFALLIYLEI